MNALRCLPLGSATGFGNMAWDEVMLRTAAERGLASLRFYTWDRPTLSLGYFQPAAAHLAEDNFSGLDWVRRATGGAAIVHDPPTEITYALALPPGFHWQPAGQSWICEIHYLVRSALREFGIDSRLVVCGEEQKFGPVLCFRHHTPGDLTVQGNKVAGSAQRKHRGALLQHGSILLERSRFAPDLLGLRELGGQAVAGHQLVARLPALLAQKTGWQLQADDWTAEEREQHYPAALDKFAQREWIEKR